MHYERYSLRRASPTHPAQRRRALLDTTGPSSHRRRSPGQPRLRHGERPGGVGGPRLLDRGHRTDLRQGRGRGRHQRTRRLGLSRRLARSTQLRLGCGREERLRHPPVPLFPGRPRVLRHRRQPRVIRALPGLHRPPRPERPRRGPPPVAHRSGRYLLPRRVRPPQGACGFRTLHLCVRDHSCDLRRQLRGRSRIVDLGPGPRQERLRRALRLARRGFNRKRPPRRSPRCERHHAVAGRRPGRRRTPPRRRRGDKRRDHCPHQLRPGAIRRDRGHGRGCRVVIGAARTGAGVALCDRQARL